MPASASRAEISRHNGAHSHGPITAEGKARAVLNATRHGLCARTLILGEGEDQAELDALRAALLARHLPLDAAESHWVDELVFVAWRQRRLRTLEDVVLARAGAADTAPALPSLATLIRYRARLDRDWRRAVDELATLRRARAGLPDPAQLRRIADGIERGRQGMSPEAAPVPPQPSHAQRNGTNEPKGPPPPAERTNELPSTLAHGGTNEPAPPPPRVAKRTNELPPPTPALNRHQRRRLAALARRELRHAA